MGQRGRPRHPDVLTPREQDVLALIRDGLTNEQIADRLNIGFETAKSHVAEILSKLGVATREEAAAWQPTGERARGWSFGRIVLSIAGVGVVAAAVAGLALLAWGAAHSSTGSNDETSRQTTSSSARATAENAATPATVSGLRDIQQSLVALHAGMFLNQDVGWITADGQTSNLLFTPDAGLHWTLLHKFQTILKSIDFVDQRNGWAVSYDGILKTGDGGSSWSKLSPRVSDPKSQMEIDGIPFQDAQQIDFVDEQTGWMGGLDTLYRTADGGNTWNGQPVPCAPNAAKGFTYIGAMSFVDAQTGWMACPDPNAGLDNGAPPATVAASLFKTADGGATWQALPALEFQPDAIRFLNESSGWAGASRLLYSTADGGLSWQLVGRGSTDDLVLPLPVTATDLYLIYGSGALQASSDSGATWHSVYPPPLPEVATCTLNDLTANVKWTRSADPGSTTTSNQYPYTGLVDGTVTITNSGPGDCRLTTAKMNGQLLDSSGQTVAEDSATPIPGDVGLPFVLPPGDQAASTVEWSQWCEPSPPSSPLSLVLDVPDVGELTLNVSDAQGQPVKAPYCHTVFGNGPSFLRNNHLGPFSVPSNPP
jgi:photosystem II stability/assembly factor-like uncharacterized protein/DNA-binding CsgD family transcriptional regulator